MPYSSLYCSAPYDGMFHYKTVYCAITSLHSGLLYCICWMLWYIIPLTLASPPPPPPQLSDRPDSLMESLLRRLNGAVVGADSAPLARWLSVAGHTAVCHLTYLDVHVFTELKRRNRLREEAAGRKTSQRGSQDTPGSASDTPAQRRRVSGGWY